MACADQEALLHRQGGGDFSVHTEVRTASGHLPVQGSSAIVHLLEVHGKAGSRHGEPLLPAHQVWVCLSRSPAADPSVIWRQRQCAALAQRQQTRHCRRLQPACQAWAASTRGRSLQLSPVSCTHQSEGSLWAACQTAELASQQLATRCQRYRRSSRMPSCTSAHKP